jgi:hypothetical protein
VYHQIEVCVHNTQYFFVGVKNEIQEASPQVSCVLVILYQLERLVKTFSYDKFDRFYFTLAVIEIHLSKVYFNALLFLFEQQVHRWQVENA